MNPVLQIKCTAVSDINPLVINNSIKMEHYAQYKRHGNDWETGLIKIMKHYSSGRILKENQHFDIHNHRRILRDEIEIIQACQG